MPNTNKEDRFERGQEKREMYMCKNGKMQTGY